jgi:hypothetical protein
MARLEPALLLAKVGCAVRYPRTGVFRFYGKQAVKISADGAEYRVRMGL